MKNILSIATVLAVSAAFGVGCGSSDDNSNPTTTDSGSGDSVVTTDSGTRDSANTDSGVTTDSGGGETDSGGFPAVPTLGTQIDRMGRPAVNTATNHTFDTTSAKGAAKDAYNQDKDPSHWNTYVAEMEANLAILDALDGTCGNQFLADSAKTGATRYAPLAGILAADMLWVNTGVTTCTGYLAVETASTTDCGGRAPSYDVMNITYAAAAGVPLTMKLDGVSAVPDRSKGTTFPYLAAPH